MHDNALETALYSASDERHGANGAAAGGSASIYYGKPPSDGALPVGAVLAGERHRGKQTPPDSQR